MKRLIFDLSKMFKIINIRFKSPLTSCAVMAETYKYMVETYKKVLVYYSVNPIERASHF